MSRMTADRQQELDLARSMKAGWIKAEQALMTSQSFRMGTKMLTRADLAAVRESIKYWQNEIDRLQGYSRIRVQQIIPRDV